MFEYTEERKDTIFLFWNVWSFWKKKGISVMLIYFYKMKFLFFTRVVEKIWYLFNFSASTCDYHWFYIHKEQMLSTIKYPIPLISHLVFRGRSGKYMCLWTNYVMYFELRWILKVAPDLAFILQCDAKCSSFDFLFSHQDIITFWRVFWMPYCVEIALTQGKPMICVCLWICLFY